MIRRLGGGVKKYRRVFRGGVWRGFNGIVLQQTSINKNKKEIMGKVKREVATVKQKAYKGH